MFQDPFLWQDSRSNWHVLAHTYTFDPYPANSISGHGYSADGVHWSFSMTEPYSNVVRYADGSNHTFATLERPKLLFADPSDPKRPTHLFNGASPVWDTAAADPTHPGPCAACDGGICTHCKVTSKATGGMADLDYTYTLARPLA